MADSKTIESSVDSLRRMRARVSISPPKMTDAIVARLLEHFAVKSDPVAACAFAGIHPDTFYTWIAKGHDGEQPFKLFVELLSDVRRPASAGGDAGENDPAKVLTAKIVALRVRGYSFTAIADELKIKVATADKYWKRYTADVPKESVDEYRAKADGVLNEILKGHVSKAKNGDAKSAQVVISALLAHAKLLGWEAPARVDVSGAVTHNIDVTKLTYAELEQLASGAWPAGYLPPGSGGTRETPTAEVGEPAELRSGADDGLAEADAPGPGRGPAGTLTH